MPFLENVHEPDLVRHLKIKLRSLPLDREFDRRKKLLKRELMQAFGRESASAIMEEVGATQPSTSLSVINNSSFACKDKNRPLIGKKIILDLESATHRDMLQKDVERLGGTIMDAYDEERERPFCIVSDYPRVEVLEKSGRTKFGPKFISSLPLMLRCAVQNGVRIRSYASFHLSMMKLKKKIRAEKKVDHAPVKGPQVVVRTLTPPYAKLEDADGIYAPSFKEFIGPSNFRPIYLGKMSGKSIFHKVTREAEEKRRKEEKGMKVRRPPRPKAQACNGFCEICAVSCENLLLHYAGHEHQQRISQPGFYCEVDALCGSYTEDIVVPNIPLQKRREMSPLAVEEECTTGYANESASSSLLFRDGDNGSTSGC
uniref:DBF4-type domain-containing protein n=1 Tax=Parascaris univalens TaxID=6257 RepID=A0A915ANY4_PARUN